MIKFAVLLCAVVLVHGEKERLRFTPAFLEAVVAKGTSCTVQYGVGPTALAQLLAATIPNTPVNQKFVYCFARGLGLADEDGHFNVDKMLLVPQNDIHKKAFKEVLEECNKKSGKDKYDTMFMVHECFHSNVPVTFGLD